MAQICSHCTFDPGLSQCPSICQGLCYARYRHCDRVFITVVLAWGTKTAMSGPAGLSSVTTGLTLEPSSVDAFSSWRHTHKNGDVPSELYAWLGICVVYWVWDTRFPPCMHLWTCFQYFRDVSSAIRLADTLNSCWLLSGNIYITYLISLHLSSQLILSFSITYHWKSVRCRQAT